MWIEKTKNWLKPGGVLALSTPYYTDQYNILRSRHFKPEEHLWFYSKTGLDRLLRKQGFQLISETEEPGRDSIALRIYSQV